MDRTIYDAMGGAPAVLALATAWHERCLADPILSHAFEGGVHPDHTARLAAYWAEQLGGPAAYSDKFAEQADVIRLHSGNGPHPHMDGRGVGAFALAMDDAGLPDDPELRAQLVAWFTWATALLNHQYASADDVPEGIAFPKWDWNGTEGW